MTLTYEQVTDYLSAYAIGALDAEEQDAVDEYFHLQEVLRQKLASAESATTLLAQDVDHAELAGDAKERLMARVLGENPDVASAGMAGAEIDDKLSVADDRVANVAAPVRRPNATPLTQKRMVQRPSVQSQTTQSKSVQGEPRSVQSADPQSNSAKAAAQKARQWSAEASEPKAVAPSFWGYLQGLVNGRALVNAALVASIAALFVVGALSSQLDKQVRDLQVTVSEREGTLTQAETENRALVAANEKILGEMDDLEIIYQETAVERIELFDKYQRLQNQLAANNERITLVGAASQATVMFGTDEAPGLQGTFFHKDEEGALVVHGLKPLPIDQTYQFWLVTENGEQLSAGLFAVDGNAEPTWANLNLPQDVPAYSIVGITVEPATGSDFPTGPMLLESGIEIEELSL